MELGLVMCLVHSGPGLVRGHHLGNAAWGLADVGVESLGDGGHPGLEVGCALAVKLICLFA
eukprot:scaffold259090_cov19-Tisochrysis_lutea.AAC.3